MPRRIAVQVPQTISRLVEGGYLKSAPVSYQALLLHPPVALPARAPVPRPTSDLPASLVRAAHKAEGNPSLRRDPMNSQKRLRSRQPSLQPRPIVYLHDRVRKQFYLDHPWEGLRPRIIVETERAQQPVEVPAEVTELTWWSTNPQPEDVIALTVHLHEKHSVSLSQGYQHAIRQYHALRAEHETASRYALLEAQAYGARFGPSAPKYLREQIGNRVWHAAPETYRGFIKQEKALDSWAAAASQSGAVVPSSKVVVKMRMRPSVTGEWTGGEEYRRGARAIISGRADALANARVEKEKVGQIVLEEEEETGTPTNDPFKLSQLGGRLEEKAAEGARARW